MKASALAARAVQGQLRDTSCPVLVLNAKSIL